MYARRFRILWEEKKVFLIMCVGFLVLNKKIDNTDDREKMLYLLVQSCIYYCLTCSYDILHQLFKFSNVAFEKLSQQFQMKAECISSIYICKSLEVTKTERHGVTGLIFSFTSAHVLQVAFVSESNSEFILSGIHNN